MNPEKDLTAEALYKIKFKELHPYYPDRYRKLKAVEHLFPGEGILKVIEMVSYLKKKGFDGLNEEDVSKKYQHTGPGRPSSHTLF